MDKTKKEGNMKKLKILAVVLALMMGLCVFSGCSDAEVKVGHYVSEDGRAYIDIEANLMHFSEDIAISVVRWGPYTIKYNKLTYTSSDNHVYVFKIKGDRLILLRGAILVEKGTVFTFEGE